MASATPQQTLPLFAWPAVCELQTARLKLIARIAALPRYSHRRVELESRLRALTAEQMSLQVEIER